MQAAPLVGLILILLVLSSFSLVVTYHDPTDYLQWSKPHPYFSNFSISWTMIDSPQFPCSNTAGANSGVNLYQVCGRDSSLQVYPNIQRYAGSWSVLAAPHPAGGVYNHSAAYITNKIVVSGGNTSPGIYYDYTTVYNTSSNTWLLSTPMPQAHMINTTMVSNGTNTCWLLGGEIGGTGTVLNTVYKWSPDALAMDAMALMPAPRKNAAAAYFWNNKIYVFGGAVSGNTGTNTIWLYDCIANSWAVVPMLLTHARTGAAAVQTMYTDIFVLGGQNGATYLNSVERYRPEDNTLIDVAPMLFTTAGMAAGGEGWGFPNDEDYGGMIFVSGGYNGAVVTLANQASIMNGAVEASSLGNIKALYHQ